MPNAYLPSWMNEADVGTIALLTLDDGERFTAEVRRFDDESNELIVDVLPQRKHPKKSQRDRAIPIHRVVSFEPQLSAEQEWPYSDPCRARSFSFPRFLLMATLFLCMIVGSVPLFLVLVTRPYGLQAASAIVYTLFAVFMTFARTGGRFGKDLPPYLFTCPAVRPQLTRLLWRHFGFLVVLFALQTLALAARPHLPYWWTTESAGRGGTWFDVVLLFLSFGVGWTEVLTNRSMLNRAHQNFNARDASGR